MSTGPRTVWDDAVLPFQLDGPDVRGRIARLGGTLDSILAMHQYPAAIESLIAETALLAALMGQTIKLRWKLSLQVRGTGPIRLIAADNYAPNEEGEPARIRAYASFDRAGINAGGPGFPQIGQGYFAVLMDQGNATTPYRGITPIAGGSLAACAETFFAQSERLPSRFVLAHGRSRTSDDSGGWHGAGIMLQHMPKASISESVDIMDNLEPSPSMDIPCEGHVENWRRVNVLLDTVEEGELIGSCIGSPELLMLLFHQERLRVLPPQPVRFGCTCSADRVRTSLSIYSARDIGHMTTERGLVVADCQFCGAHYEFDPRTLGFEAQAETSGDG